MRARRASAVQLALLGAAAGAAGTTALNAVTYLDMALRGRPTSSTPEDTVEVLSDKTRIPIPGEGESHDNRVAGLGPLTGIATGVGVGAALGAARARGWRPSVGISTAAATVAALLGSNGPMTALGVTDPRTWPASSWLADLVPHLAYGAATAAVLERLDPRAR
jgi:hypothetical protein